ncbi:MAG: glycosyltransferase family 9 protein [Candidatus Omnitrophica bacterium]|nr:glycosyltransferase family 9 protein [Candidatus Omnitrophota bacterium]
MKLGFIRKIDRYIGPVVCFFLCSCEKLRSLLKTAAQEETGARIEKILVIKFWGFGSIVLSFDAFQLIRQRFPEARIYVLTLKQNRQIYEMCNLFDEIIEIEIRSFFTLISDTAKTIARLRKVSFDAALDFEFTSRYSALLTFFSGAKRRLGFNYKGIFRGGCFTKELSFKENIKIKESFLDLAGLIAPRKKDAVFPCRLTLDKKHSDHVDSLFIKEGLDEAYPVIGVNINASELSFLRRWPKEYFRDLINGLVRRYHAHIILIGDKSDEEYVRGFAKGFSPENVHNFAGKTSLLDLACLMRRFNLFISNDSGPLHLAAYLGVPTVSFFGPETPLMYGPEGVKHIVFYENLSCSPCIRVSNYKHFRCNKGQLCLRKIYPRIVIDEIERKRIFQ